MCNAHIAHWRQGSISHSQTARSGSRQHIVRCPYELRAIVQPSPLSLLHRSWLGLQRLVDHGGEHLAAFVCVQRPSFALRSEEHTSELQSLMRISYAVFCLKKKKKLTTIC